MIAINNLSAKIEGTEGNIIRFMRASDSIADRADVLLK